MKSYRLGVVSYLNSRPLIHGLEGDDAFKLFFEVPSRLPGLLDAGEVDAALVPVVDLAAESRDWGVVSDACIGCDGETFTVRVFSRVPPERVTHLFVDGDSHTSIALAEVLWRRHYGRELVISPYRSRESAEDCQAVLLIGDKVVNHRLIDYDIETDLGSAWKSMTGLPFVFAVWAAPRGQVYTDLAAKLNRARDAGVACVDDIAERIAPTMGWPVELARRYLGRRLNYRLTERHRQGMKLFLDLAREHDLISQGSEILI